MNPKLSPKEVQTILQSPQAQKLVRALQETDTAVMNQAVEWIKAGKHDKAAQLLQPVVGTDDNRQLLRELQSIIG